MLSGAQLDLSLKESFSTGALVLPFPKSSFIEQKFDISCICRDGVSEGQFNQVLLEEMDAIRKVYELIFLRFLGSPHNLFFRMPSYW